MLTGALVYASYRTLGKLYVPAGKPADRRFPPGCCMALGCDLDGTIAVSFLPSLLTGTGAFESVLWQP